MKQLKTMKQLLRTWLGNKKPARQVKEDVNAQMSELGIVAQQAQSKQIPKHYVDSLEYFRNLNDAMTQNQPISTQDLTFARLALLKLGAKFYHEYNQELGELLHIKELIKK